MFENIIECENIDEMKEIISEIINDNKEETDLEDLKECLLELYNGERLTKRNMKELMEYAADTIDEIC